MDSPKAGADVLPPPGLLPLPVWPKPGPVTQAYLGPCPELDGEALEGSCPTSQPHIMPLLPPHAFLSIHLSF